MVTVGREEEGENEKEENCSYAPDRYRRRTQSRPGKPYRLWRYTATLGLLGAADRADWRERV